MLNKEIAENGQHGLPVGKKMYYSISEVCAMTGLEPHVLRYWETEFSKLRPKKNSAGKRAYREKDIELVNQIKRLLYDEKYTLDGAKKKIAGDRRSLKEADAPARNESGGGDGADMPKSRRTQPTRSMPGSMPAALSTPPTKSTASMPSTTPPVPQNVISDIRKDLADVLALLEP
ncbi:MAG: MerR family transcriptional regulator [Chitinispirillales bacterium]|jgi:DNA-binding transcriptional MerR regulator|nr:MerR family transcriptional regulator [Chitinispirillales bacterium]